jgi:hypothetical protein
MSVAISNGEPLLCFVQLACFLNFHGPPVELAGAGDVTSTVTERKKITGIGYNHKKLTKITHALLFYPRLLI